MPADTKPRQPSEYWMRSVSFAGLHRLLHVIAEHSKGLRPQDLNEIVLDKSIPLMRGRLNPSPTTLYHYRNTLIRLGALTKDGSTMRVSHNNTDVCGLLQLSAPSDDAEYLTGPAQEHFGNLVLQNEQCRSLFFDLFMPADLNDYSVSEFCRLSSPAEWTRSSSRKVVLHNAKTSHTLSCATPASINAIVYGLRYWGKDELGLIDEYPLRASNNIVMFPLACQEFMCSGESKIVMSIVQALLSQRGSDDWTLFSIDSLIKSICISRKVSINLLFRSIDWLYENHHGRIMLVPTSRGLATMTVSSTKREEMQLRKYYKRKKGPYISHIRVHKDISIESARQEVYHAK